jgi:hypothetical protein
MSLDLRRCPDAATNCSRTGSAVCPFSTSGCRGGMKAQSYCAEGLDGPFCRLCRVKNQSERLYYQPASNNAMARCVSCGRTVRGTLSTYMMILLAALLVAMACVVLVHKVPHGFRQRMSSLQHILRPETCAHLKPNPCV